MLYPRRRLVGNIIKQVIQRRHTAAAHVAINIHPAIGIGYRQRPPHHIRHRQIGIGVRYTDGFQLGTHGVYQRFGFFQPFAGDTRRNTPSAVHCPRQRPVNARSHIRRVFVRLGIRHHAPFALGAGQLIAVAQRPRQKQRTAIFEHINGIVTAICALIGIKHAGVLQQPCLHLGHRRNIVGIAHRICQILVFIPLGKLTAVRLKQRIGKRSPHIHTGKAELVLFRHTGVPVNVFGDSAAHLAHGGKRPCAVLHHLVQRVLVGTRLFQQRLVEKQHLHILQIRVAHGRICRRKYRQLLAIPCNGQRPFLIFHRAQILQHAAHPILRPRVRIDNVGDRATRLVGFQARGDQIVLAIPLQLDFHAFVLFHLIQFLAHIAVGAALGGIQRQPAFVGTRHRDDVARMGRRLSGGVADSCFPLISARLRRGRSIVVRLFDRGIGSGGRGFTMGLLLIVAGRFAAGLAGRRLRWR